MRGLFHWEGALVETRVVRVGTGLEAAMQPHVLLRGTAHRGLNLAVGAGGIDQVVAARVAFQRRSYVQGVALLGTDVVAGQGDCVLDPGQGGGAGDGGRLLHREVGHEDAGVAA